MDTPTTESPHGTFLNPGTMSHEALSVPSGFNGLITSTTSQVQLLPDHTWNTGDLANTSGRIASEIVSQYEQVQLWLIIEYTVVVVAILGNCVLNHVIMKYKSVHTTTGLFICNISVTNMMLAFLISSPFKCIVHYLCNSLVFGKMTCHFSHFVQYSCAYVTVITMASISLDKHQMMLYPLKSWITPMQDNVSIIIIWIVSNCAPLPHSICQKFHQVEIG
uniref:G-protein coupled receptors family 1 profile domain-containing protein n=1 Tax=Theropithecus gelada TaxID=9565 RepID=A0A8D2EVY9_THEGE